MSLLLLVCLATPSFLTAATKTWTGASNGNWSNGANWSGGVAPAPDDDLVFPSAAIYGTTNDLPAGSQFHSLTFSAPGSYPGYSIFGNGFTVSGGIDAAQTSGHVGFVVPIALTASQTWSSGSNELDFYSPVDLGANNLSISGPAKFTEPISGSGGLAISAPNGGVFVTNATHTYSGPTTVSSSAEVLCMGCVIPSPVSVAGIFRFDSGVGGNQTVPRTGALTSRSGRVMMNRSGATGSLALDAASTFTVNAYSAASPSTLAVTGAVTLGDAALAMNYSYTPAAGDVITVIDNDGSDPISGTFAHLPEGATVGSARISYHGGSGNDVTLTFLPPQIATHTALVSTPNPSSPLESVSLTATVTSSSGPLAGSVTFYDGATVLGAQPLGGGTATLTVLPLTTGVHTLSATFVSSASGFAGSASPAVLQSVTELPTSTSLKVSPNPTYAGNLTTLIAAVTASGATPAGSVTFYDGPNSLATEALSGGNAVVTVGPLARGEHTLTATYVPAAGFAGSSSAPRILTVSVAPKPTVTTLEVSPRHGIQGRAVTLTATVDADGSMALGSVVFSDGDVLLDSQPLTAGTVSITTSALAVGSHFLRAAFLPLSEAFAPSVSDIVEASVDAPRRRAAGGH